MMDELNMDCQDVEKFYPTIVKGFNNKKLQEAFITTPKIVCDYISALQRVLDMSEETNKKALAKIKELSKAIDVFYNSERKTIVDLHEANERLKAHIEKAGDEFAIYEILISMPMKCFHDRKMCARELSQRIKEVSDGK